jgi:hypothetical protein
MLTNGNLENSNEETESIHKETKSVAITAETPAQDEEENEVTYFETVVPSTSTETLCEDVDVEQPVIVASVPKIKKTVSFGSAWEFKLVQCKIIKNEEQNTDPVNALGRLLLKCMCIINTS